MLAIQSDIAKCHCLNTQGAVAFQTPGVFFLRFFYSSGTIPDFSFIPESTRWLRLNGKSQQAIDILKQIGKFNEKDVPDFDLVTVQQDTSKGKSHFVNLFRPKKIAITSLIQGYAW